MLLSLIQYSESNPTRKLEGCANSLNEDIVGDVVELMGREEINLLRVPCLYSFHQTPSHISKSKDSIDWSH